MITLSLTFVGGLKQSTIVGNDANYLQYLSTWPGSNQLLRANLHDGSVVGGRPWTAGLPVLFIAVVTTKDQL